MSVKATVAALFAIAFAGLPTMAPAQDLGGVYLGGSIGRSTNKYDPANYEASLEKLAQNGRQTLDFTDRSNNEHSRAWWVNAGFMKWNYVGLELDFLHLGEATFRSAGTLKPPAQAFEATTNVSSRGPAVALMLRAPLGNGLDLNFRVGDYYGRTAVTQGYALAGTYSPGTITTTVSSLLVGAGASFTFDGHWSAKLDYLKIKRAGDTRTGEFDLDLWTLGTSYTF